MLLLVGELLAHHWEWCLCVTMRLRIGRKRWHLGGSFDWSSVTTIAEIFIPRCQWDHVAGNQHASRVLPRLTSICTSEGDTVHFLVEGLDLRAMLHIRRTILGIGSPVRGVDRLSSVVWHIHVDPLVRLLQPELLVQIYLLLFCLDFLVSSNGVELGSEVLIAILL